MRVRGPTLDLRFATPGDAPRLFELGSDEEVTRFFSWGPYRDETEALAYVESLQARRAAGELLEFVIEAPGEGIVGVTGLSDFSARDRRATVGTWLGRPYWGSGINEESKALVLGLAFRELGLHRVSALAHPDNARSLAALERLGFAAEGVLVGWHRHGEAWRDCVILRLLESEWRGSQIAGLEFSVEDEAPSAFRVR